jgi:hypothetical protein
MQRKIEEALSLARGNVDSFIVRAHVAASDSLKERFPKCARAKTAVEPEEMLRNDVPIMLWHDLRRLRIIRNKIEHEMKADRPLMAMERPVVSRLLQDHPYALFIFSNTSQDQWHFLNVKYDDDVQKRRIFRRITVGPEERLRTASERISLLDLDSIRSEPAGSSLLEIQKRHDQAFDVESVTQEFFRTFAGVYHRVADEIAAVRSLEQEAGRLSQPLLDRLLFLYFTEGRSIVVLGEPSLCFVGIPQLWPDQLRILMSQDTAARRHLP